jgi:hypothetical protein
MEAPGDMTQLNTIARVEINSACATPSYPDLVREFSLYL